MHMSIFNTELVAQTQSFSSYVVHNTIASSAGTDLRSSCQTYSRQKAGSPIPEAIPDDLLCWLRKGNKQQPQNPDLAFIHSSH